MKQYLLAAAAVAFVGVSASENPFELNSNLKKVDSEQSRLLSALKTMAVEEDDIDLTEEESESSSVEVVAVEVVSTQEVSEDPVEAVVVEVTPQQEQQVTVLVEKDVAVEEKVVAKIVPEVAEEQVVISASPKKEEAETVAASNVSQIVKIESEALVVSKEADTSSDKTLQEIQEQEEVAAYEAQRLAKKRAVELEKKKEELAIALVEKEEPKIVAEQTDEVVEKTLDVNITKEAVLASQQAEEVYRQAMLDVDREN